MRIVGLLLAFFLLFLAVKPGVDALSAATAAEQTCCRDACTKASGNEDTAPQEEDGCDGDACNPFQVCSSCVLVCLNLYGDPLLKHPAAVRKGLTHQSLFASPFAADFWQPPRWV